MSELKFNASFIIERAVEEGIGAVAYSILGHLKKQIGATPHKLVSLSLFFALFS